MDTDAGTGTGTVNGYQTTTSAAARPAIATLSVVIMSG